MKTVVVSAVSLRKGGTLAILRSCLEYLGSRTSEYHIVALVHRRDLCDYPGIEYIELPWCTKSWAHRLWAEYVTMHRISLDMARREGEPVWMWLSLHDTTPRVLALHQEVYCHTSFPFLKVKARDWVMDPKIPLFALFTKWAYRINVHRNDSLIVQQEWFADALSRLIGVDRAKFRVIPPRPVVSAVPEIPGGSAVPEGHFPYISALPAQHRRPEEVRNNIPEFLFASTADCHKNFETLCEAARILESDGRNFKLVLTIDGCENRYSKWLLRRWGNVRSIDFHGLMSKDELLESYRRAGCFVFPSRVETWGLPISEYMEANPDGKLILADLPYARETSQGRGTFFPVTDAVALKNLMAEYIDSYEDTAIG